MQAVHAMEHTAQSRRRPRIVVTPCHITNRVLTLGERLRERRGGLRLRLRLPPLLLSRSRSLLSRSRSRSRRSPGLRERLRL